jgi:hypothetical protein
LTAPAIAGCGDWKESDVEQLAQVYWLVGKHLAREKQEREAGERE